MSSDDRAERISLLRSRVAGLERGVERAPRLPLARGLDRRLGGGLSLDGLHEIVPAAPADTPAAFGFALALAARLMEARGRSGLFAVEDFALTQNGLPFGPGLVAHGLDLSRLVFVRAPDAGALFQALEDALKSGALAVAIGEVGRAAKYDLSISRRLTLAARAGATPALLMLPPARALSTAAETRFEIAAAPGAHAPSAGAARPVPGAPGFAARIVKARGGGGGDPFSDIRLVWRAEERQFDEPAIPVPEAAAPRHRSRQESA